MGKDKKTYKFLSKVKENYNKEIRQRMSEDIFAILHDEGLQNDKYNQCWMSGFQYAFERIKTIFELKGDKKLWRNGKLRMETIFMVNQFSISQLITVVVIMLSVGVTQNVLYPRWLQSQASWTVCRKLPKKKSKTFKWGAYVSQKIH